MNEIARSAFDSLRAGTLDAALLARAGATRPAEDTLALTRAAQHPALAPSLERWLPGLLGSAEPGPGARRLVEIAEVGASGLAALAPGAALGALVGNSRFLSRWLVREPSWLADVVGPTPPSPADPAPARADWEGLRRAKYRGLLRVTARDLAGRPFEEGLRELSDLADAVLGRGLALASGAGEPPALFCLGKLGGRELNFSSDVDLLFVCEASPDADGAAAREQAGRAIRELKKRLEERTGEGFAYRVDLDLRPEGPAGALVRGVEATLAYYELRGAAWERQMLLRLRHLCGSDAAASDFEAALEPFVHPRTVDPMTIARVREMKHRIERERRAAGRNLDHELKEGPGGIRDVEFTVQALQLFYAGHHPALRTGNVLDAIEALSAAGLLPDDAAEELAAGYRWLRRAEHALQLPEEQQTARLPADAVARTAVARRMGYDAPEAETALAHFEADAARARSQVRTHFEALVLEEAED